MIRLGFLRATRVALRDPAKWTKRDHQGEGETISLLGALVVVGARMMEIEAVANAGGFDDAADCGWCVVPGLKACCPRVHPLRSLMRWNDLASTTHGDVIALLDRVIAGAAVVAA